MTARSLLLLLSEWPSDSNWASLFPDDSPDGVFGTHSLDRMIFFGRDSLESALKEFTAHYHGERNHQGLGNCLIDPGGEVGQKIGEVQCRERLGGMLRYYYRDAA